MVISSWTDLLSIKKGAPAVQDQVIDLAHTGRTVGVTLLRVNQPEIVQDEHVGMCRERSMKVESHLAFGSDSCSLSRGRRCGSVS